MNLEQFMPVIEKTYLNKYETKYKISCYDGYGYMTTIDVMEGIQVIFNDFHCTLSPEETSSQKERFLEINHCLHGRFECIFGKERYGYLGEGDMAINDWAIDRFGSGFPLGYYNGVEVLIDLNTAKENIFLRQLHIDIHKLSKKVKNHQNLFIMRSTQQIQHIFLEMYHVNEDIKIDYLKIKVAELLLFLQNKTFDINTESRRYYTKKQIECVKQIKKDLQFHTQEKYNIQSLADFYQINVNTLRKCFKDIYGKSIYQWYKEYRLQLAKQLLEETDFPIIEIAAKVGYENPSKFSSAFYHLYQQTPRNYRQTHQSIYQNGAF